ncbi:MAG: YqhA family protein [Planctomycetota bacterium]|jgi:uncharacterized membrane protein YqhA
MDDPYPPARVDHRPPLERAFELVLWRSRLVVLLAVVGSLLTAIVMFLLATADVVHLVQELWHLAGVDGHERLETRKAIITGVVEVIDGYLLAAILLIFALGLYELFISRIDDAVGDQASANVLVINSLDDLKTRLGKVILMVLVVKFFEFGISMDIVEPMDLLLFGGGIALVGVALWLTNAKAHAD